MKLLLDFFPIILFFVAFKMADIYVATGVAIVATVAQIAWLRWRSGKVETMQWLSLGVIVLFGGATLIAHDETFIKWKPTILYWLMGGSLLLAQLIWRRNLIKSLIGDKVRMAEPAWTAMRRSWTVFFLFMGVLNLWVAYNFDTATWVDFKLFGGLGLMAVFVIGQSLWLGKHIESDEAANQESFGKPDAAKPAEPPTGISSPERSGEPRP
ncbi:MAG: septation protein A [Ramlibacter sp.]|jgi:intracellular septation protein|uniref:septation protein A n=1 Tax=Ramlibacter sp. TaxID=1917967 RepID=UPI0026097D26|nr:septation protein A [Ramlibacter sp.]MDH4376838.1 septation protein A [Ramlibacter sp.]